MRMRPWSLGKRAVIYSNRYIFSTTFTVAPYWLYLELWIPECEVKMFCREMTLHWDSHCIQIAFSASQKSSQEDLD